MVWTMKEKNELAGQVVEGAVTPGEAMKKGGVSRRTIDAWVSAYEAGMPPEPEDQDLSDEAMAETTENTGPAGELETITGPPNTEKIKLARQVVGGLITPEEAMKMGGVSRRTIDAWVSAYDAGRPPESEDPPDEGDLKDLPETLEDLSWEDPVGDLQFDDSGEFHPHFKIGDSEFFEYDKCSGDLDGSEGLWKLIFAAIDNMERRGSPARLVCIGGGVKGGGNPWYWWREQKHLATQIEKRRVISKAVISGKVVVFRCNSLGEFVVIC